MTDPVEFDKKRQKVDNMLLESLQELAIRLEISWCVHFTGWVGDRLPHVLSGIDIIINTSLGAWSETFCFANIEVMSIEIPLITFAVGGKLS